MSNFDPIGTVAFFRERHRAETITTCKILRAMTPEMMMYRHDPKASTLGVIAWTVVRCLAICNGLTHNDSAEVTHDEPPAHPQLLLAFDHAAEQLGPTLLAITQKEWQEPRTVMSGSRTLLHQPLGQILWLFHADSIHHRGQLSVFLRAFGAKVPSIYGPSGDSQS
jgi:uncharacterized damage-inducible protein DinB